MSGTITLRRPRVHRLDARFESWLLLLPLFRRRAEEVTVTACGLRTPRLAIADRYLEAVATVFTEVEEQRCGNHRIVNVLDTLPHKGQGESWALLTQIPYAEPREYERYQRTLFNRHTRLL